MNRNRRHRSIQSSLHHYTKTLTNTSTKENVDNVEDNSSINSFKVNSKSKKSTAILGDSTLKHLNGWEMSKKFYSDCKIFVKHFSGAATSSIPDYIKSSLQKDPNHIGNKRLN